MNKLKLLVVGMSIAGIFLLLASCGSTKDIVYFQNTQNLQAYNDLAHYEIRIAPKDNLLIYVSALHQEAVEPFNSVNFSRTAYNLEWQGYLVDEDGNINFPEIGVIHLGGLTKAEAIDLLQTKISAYVEKPVVNMRFLNYKISVLGEVNRPGTYTVENERISILEAIAKAGDMTIYGQRRTIQVCRVENQERKFYQVDITSPSIFFSPVYYLQQNDIVYVLPNKARAMSSNYNPLIATFVSTAGLLISVTNLIVNLRK